MHHIFKLKNNHLNNRDSNFDQNIAIMIFSHNLPALTGSSGACLPRSTDYGATYQKLNDKVGPKTILSYLYVSPNNKRKVILTV